MKKYLLFKLKNGTTRWDPVNKIFDDYEDVITYLYQNIFISVKSINDLYMIEKINNYHYLYQNDEYYLLEFDRQLYQNITKKFNNGKNTKKS